MDIQVNKEQKFDYTGKVHSVKDYKGPTFLRNDITSFPHRRSCLEFISSFFKTIQKRYREISAVLDPNALHNGTSYRSFQMGTPPCW